MKKTWYVFLLLPVTLLASSCQKINSNGNYSSNYKSNANIANINSVNRISEKSESQPYDYGRARKELGLQSPQRDIANYSNIVEDTSQKSSKTSSATISPPSNQEREIINYPNDPEYLRQLAFDQLNAKNIPRGNGVVIAVIDDFYYNHVPEDWSSESIHPRSKNFDKNNILATTEDFKSLPQQGDIKRIHGWFNAAIIVQATNNGKGSAAIAYEALVMLLNVFKENKKSELEYTAKAIRYAVENGADIVNISMEFPLYNEYIEDALEYAFNNNVLIVVSAGNGAGYNNSFLSTKSDGKLVVYSVNKEGKKSSFSDDGEVGASGGEYLPSGDSCTEEITDEPGIYQTLSILQDDIFEDTLVNCVGTSQATAYASGIAASVKQILKAAGIESPVILEEILKYTARKEDGANTEIIDAGKAVELAKKLVDNQTPISDSEKKFASLIEKKGYELMGRGLEDLDSSKLQSVLTIFNDVDKFIPNQISSFDWNQMCWYGGLLAAKQQEEEYLRNITYACDKAVMSARRGSRGYYDALDSRAVVSALIGNISQARKDFDTVSNAISSRRYKYKLKGEKKVRRKALLKDNQLISLKGTLDYFWEEYPWQDEPKFKGG